MKSSIVGQSLDRSHAIIIPMPCKSWDCPTCGPRKRSMWIARLAAGQPEREMTLTCPVGKFASPRHAAIAMKTAFSKLVIRIRKKWGVVHYALVWELTAKHVPHCHVLMRGAYIAQKWISKQWDLLGIGPIVYINSVKGTKLHAAHACKYLSKSNGQTAHTLAPLRVIQVSPGYVLPSEKPLPPAQYPDYVWVWDKRPAFLVALDFKEHIYTTGVIPHDDGTIEIAMHPHPVDDDMIEAPALWAAYPGLAPILDFDE